MQLVVEFRGLSVDRVRTGPGKLGKLIKFA